MAKLNVIIAMLENSNGKPVAVIAPDGTKQLDLNGKVQYIPGLFRHTVLHNNELITFKSGESKLTGKFRLVEQEYQKNKFWVEVGCVTSSKEAEEFIKLRDTVWE